MNEMIYLAEPWVGVLDPKGTRDGAQWVSSFFFASNNNNKKVPPQSIFFFCGDGFAPITTLRDSHLLANTVDR